MTRHRPARTGDKRLAELRRLSAPARAEGRELLTEPEGLAVLELFGIGVPRHRVVSRGAELEHLDLSWARGDQVVLKAVAPGLLHKTEAGAVALVTRDPEVLAVAARRMAGRLRGVEIRGYLVSELVPHPVELGGELLVSVRWNVEFGPVLCVGGGGIAAEALAAGFQPGENPAIAAALGFRREEAEQLTERAAIARLASRGIRGRPGLVTPEAVASVLERFAEIGRSAMPAELSELEVNPLAVTTDGRLIALDVLARLGPGTEPVAPPPRPLRKLRHMLQPDSLAIVGVSERVNPGRVILGNLIAGGFDRDRIFVVKPDTRIIDGCACVPDLESLPAKIDLLVLAVAARQIPDLLTRVLRGQLAESVIVIPGGLDEAADGGQLAETAKRGELSEATDQRSAMRAVRDELRVTRATEWGGPVIAGGNTLGIISRPGRCDTTFIPGYKLKQPTPGQFRVAVVSQSGAFAVSKVSKIPGIELRYSISVGNQLDLTVGDYLTYLADDGEIDLFALYLEGLRPLDGARTTDAIRGIVAGGRPVVVYKAGRTREGSRATATHTAAMAGDYYVARELLRQAGADVCEHIADFDELIKVFALLAGRPVRGRRLGAVSNAGFECVAVADHLGELELTDFAPDTLGELRAVLNSCRLEGIVEARNPLDLTPIADDRAYEDAVRSVLGDEGVDLGVVGCVPLTPALDTLGPGAGADEDLNRPDSVGMRLARLWDEIQKPWVAVVDAGPAYDPLARLLEGRGVPTFRSMDRAMELLDRYATARLGASA